MVGKARAIRCKVIGIEMEAYICTPATRHKTSEEKSSMLNLSNGTLIQIAGLSDLEKPGSNVLNLAEKVLQFGTGVLLRGLPDYFIDKANKQGVFNGRVIVVKSTSPGGTDAFDRQDQLYTHCIRGVENGVKIEKNIINASISRVLSASDHWNKVLECAKNSELQLIISNTTEVGISLVADDRVDRTPPVSFPGKLLAFLHARYKAFQGDPARGMVIIPTELIVNNGDKLASIVLELAGLNQLDSSFISWLKNQNHFCNSLVDRIVPGKLPVTDKKNFEQKFGYNDDLMIMSESYSLWAIETGNIAVKEKLSFYKTDAGVVIADNIEKFRELKLRLLNGTHTLTCALAFLSGCATVKDAMNDPDVSAFVSLLMLNEIAPAIVSSNLSLNEAKAFAEKVMDRFKNPFIEHQWLSISVQYSSKMKMRVIPVLLKHYQQTASVPKFIALGFAAYLVFMNCRKSHVKFSGSAGAREYTINDDQAGWFAERREMEDDELVSTVLSDVAFWGHNISNLPGFAEAVSINYKAIVSGEVTRAIKACIE